MSDSQPPRYRSAEHAIEHAKRAAAARRRDFSATELEKEIQKTHPEALHIGCQHDGSGTCIGHQPAHRHEHWSRAR